MRLFSMYGWIRTHHSIDSGLHRFASRPWAGGAVLLICVIAAMLLSNLPVTKEYYHYLLHTDIFLVIGAGDGFANWTFPQDMTIEKFINDALMVLFFFTVGLEIKREIACGQLSTFRKAALPVLAAIGGMIVPAIIFSCFNMGTPAEKGWGIPTATDIAFAIGILTMLGNRVPVSLKIFLTALAIADDLGAIVVIALFYGGNLNLDLLAIAIAIMTIVYLFNRMGEKRLAFYLIPGIIVWALFYYSGVHSTLSGVAMAMLIPMDARYSKEYYLHKMKWINNRLLESGVNIEKGISPTDFPNDEHRYWMRQKKRVASGAIGLSYRLESALSPYVTFIVMPVFALANAGVEISSLSYLNIFHSSPETGALGVGIFFGLVLGKPIGIFLSSFIAVKLRLAEIPEHSSWTMLFAVACLGGIGFTMSIFVDALAFSAPEMIDRGKIAVLMGSVTAAILGSLLILLLSTRGTDD